MAKAKKSATVPELTKEQKIHCLHQMMQIRAFEDKVFELLARDVLKGASHVYAGQEAIAVGACAAITEHDYITSTHRGHGHCLARGGKLDRMLAELCGKATGYCKGRGGSMHIAETETGNLGATGIVAGNIPVATGAGLACQMTGKGQVVLCFFGDGASNNGTFHESLNMAGLWKLPVVYICENNHYGMSVSVERACSVKDIAVRGASYNMPGHVVDGMKVLEVHRAVAEAVERARDGEGPTLLECKAYRYRGHSRSDPRKYRTKEEEEHWHSLDPIQQYAQLLNEDGTMTAEEVGELHMSVEQEMAEAEKFTLEDSPWPNPEELFDDVYVGWKQGPMGLERI